MKLEVCVDSYSSALTAIKAGANRLEICSALNIGGLTPSCGLLKQTIEHKEVERFVMIRPRSGDFLYDRSEFMTMLSDIELVRDMGFDGIVTGMLLPNGRIDIASLKDCVEAAYPMAVSMHRAFDHSMDSEEDLLRLIEIGVCRILTSGKKANASEGARFISSLNEKFGTKIEIMPGGGVNADNIEEIYRITKCRNFHLSGRARINSNMVFRNCIREMGIQESEFEIEIAQFDLINKVRRIIDKIELMEDVR